jgi:hypothetical protein
MPASDAAPAPRKPRRARRLAAHTRAILLWGVGFFIAAHVGLLVGTQGRWPQLRDPEFGYKLMRLRRHLGGEPNRPVLLVLGSSRTGQGVRPGVLPDLAAPDGRKVLVYNFSQVGSGPLAELVTLHRLLDEGVRPTWLAVEVLAPVLCRKNDSVGNPKLGVSRLTWRDVRLLRHYVPEPEALTRHWIESQLAPWYAHRFSMMNHYAADALPWRLRMDHWKALDDWGWSDLGLDDDDKVNDPTALELARKTYQDDLKHYDIAPMMDRALRDLLALCRRRAIPTVLYLMPEGRVFQSWYAPAARARIDTYLTRLSRECRVPIVDARNWMEDDYFFDNHHLNRHGATAFTRRFGAEVIPPLLQGKLDAILSVLVPLPAAYPDEPREPFVEARGRAAAPSPPTLSINGEASENRDAAPFRK